MIDAEHRVLAFAAFPGANWQKIWSTNPLERINTEIKRRSRMVGIFPNKPSAIRLLGAILSGSHDEWKATELLYLSEHSMSLLYASAIPSHSRTHDRQPTPRLNQHMPPLNGTPHSFHGSSARRSRPLRCRSMLKPRWSEPVRRTCSRTAPPESFYSCMAGAARRLCS